MTNQQRWAIAILQTRPDQGPDRVPSGAERDARRSDAGSRLAAGWMNRPMADPVGGCTDRRRRARIAATNGHPWRITMDKKAKNPKKPKQTKTKDGAGKGK